MFVRRISILPILILIQIASLCWSYQYGDEVNIFFKTPSNSWSGYPKIIDALRHQLPTFGYDREVQIDLSTLIDSSPDIGHIQSISLSVASRDLPWIPLHDERGRELNVLGIQMKYNVGVHGHGDVNSVRVDSEYLDSSNNDKEGHNSFTIKYTWSREAEIDQDSGIFFMAIATVIISLISFIRACNEGEERELEGNTEGKYDTSYNHHQTIYDEYHKSKTKSIPINVALQSTSKKD